MVILRQRLKCIGGLTDIFVIERKFRVIDRDNSGSIDFNEFAQIIVEHGNASDWTPAQIKILFDSFDADKSGFISYDEFFYALIGMLNERRAKLVLMAFQVNIFYARYIFIFI
jgi:hypothetical protein